MKFVDVFAGIGGFHYAVKSVVPNATCVLSVEKDKACQGNYVKNHGIVPSTDITTLNLKDIPEHDLLFGGFPCQTFSRNGRYYNFCQNNLEEDDRSLLVNYLLRILSSKQPRYALFENVKGILTIDNGNVYRYIVEAIQELGYHLDVLVLDAADYGFAQQRKRVYFCCTLSGKAIEPPQVIQRGAKVLDVSEGSPDSHYDLEHLWRNRYVKLQRPDKVNHPYPQGTKRFDVIEYLIERNERATDATGKITPLAIIYGDTPSGLPRQQDKVYSAQGISPTLATFSTPAFDMNGRLRQLTPRECARLQGFDDAHVLPMKDSLAYKQLGNAVHVGMTQLVIENLLRQ